MSTHTKLRLLGIFPLSFFLAQGVHYWKISELGNMLWMCNVGNLILAVGAFIDNRRLMRVAIIWTIPGLLIWFLYVVLAWGVFLTSTLAHVGGIIVGMLMLMSIGMARGTWQYAFGWYLLVQLLARLFTPRNLNVNLAYKIQPGWEQLFGGYWQFWLVLTIVVALSLWVVEIVCRKIWPVQVASRELPTTVNDAEQPHIRAKN